MKIKNALKIFTLSKTVFLLPFLLWWVPIIGPFFTGLLLSYYFKANYRLSVISAIVYSVFLSIITTYVFYIVRINILDNIFHYLVISLNVIGSIICVITAYMSSQHGTFAKIIGNSIELEFNARDINEVDKVLSQYFDVNLCSKPNIRFISENQITVTRICNNLQINYDIVKVGNTLRVKAKFENTK
ncbi:hypothetical protein V6M85_05745 [Sulfolobus tengchongensis]|uniref:Uncharacterized protein n=1 Tax=Sulfolobus tengchongensis TaxID=207809 RepID=A0AAX4L304_9CREN